jgi:hypothetical protein
VKINHPQMNSVALWIEKDNVKVWLNKDMPSQDYIKINNQILIYDQNGDDTYNIQLNQIESGVDNCFVLLM